MISSPITSWFAQSDKPLKMSSLQDRISAFQRAASADEPDVPEVPNTRVGRFAHRFSKEDESTPTPSPPFGSPGLQPAKSLPKSSPVSTEGSPSDRPKSASTSGTPVTPEARAPSQVHPPQASSVASALSRFEAPQESHASPVSNGARPSAMTLASRFETPSASPETPPMPKDSAKVPALAASSLRSGSENEAPHSPMSAVAIASRFETGNRFDNGKSHAAPSTGVPALSVASRSENSTGTDAPTHNSVPHSSSSPRSYADARSPRSGDARQAANASPISPQSRPVASHVQDAGPFGGDGPQSPRSPVAKSIAARFENAAVSNRQEEAVSSPRPSALAVAARFGQVDAGAPGRADNATDGADSTKSDAVMPAVLAKPTGEARHAVAATEKGESVMNSVQARASAFGSQMSPQSGPLSGGGGSNSSLSSQSTPVSSLSSAMASPPVGSLSVSTTQSETPESLRAKYPRAAMFPPSPSPLMASSGSAMSQGVNSFRLDGASAPAPASNSSSLAAEAPRAGLSDADRGPSQAFAAEHNNNSVGASAPDRRNVTASERGISPLQSHMIRAGRFGDKLGDRTAPAKSTAAGDINGHIGREEGAYVHGRGAADRFGETGGTATSVRQGAAEDARGTHAYADRMSAREQERSSRPPAPVAHRSPSLSARASMFEKDSAVEDERPSSHEPSPSLSARASRFEQGANAGDAMKVALGGVRESQNNASMASVESARSRISAMEVSSSDGSPLSASPVIAATARFEARDEPPARRLDDSSSRPQASRLSSNTPLVANAGAQDASGSPILGRLASNPTASPGLSARVSVFEKGGDNLPPLAGRLSSAPLGGTDSSSVGQRASAFEKQPSVSSTNSTDENPFGSAGSEPKAGVASRAAAFEQKGGEAPHDASRASGASPALASMAAKFEANSASPPDLPPLGGKKAVDVAKTTSVFEANKSQMAQKEAAVQKQTAYDILRAASGHSFDSEQSVNEAGSAQSDARTVELPPVPKDAINDIAALRETNAALVSALLELTRACDKMEKSKDELKERIHELELQSARDGK